MWRQRMAALVVVMLTVGCLMASGQTPTPRNVILATTTSTQDSGLLDTLVPLFEQKTGYRVKTIAVGTGQSLAMGARGDADLVLAHAPDLEKKYIAEGSMLNRRLVMHNDFILVGPPADPARLKGLTSAVEAFRRIAAAKMPFVSRGDQSGTHFLEKTLWKKAQVEPAGPWYIEAGQGMGTTLGIASEKRAYTVSDRGTYLAFGKRVELEILVEGDAPLLNLYHVMEVNPTKFPKVNTAGARAFADFLLSSEVQAIIKTFGMEKFGQPLFFPDAGRSEEDRGSRIETRTRMSSIATFDPLSSIFDSCGD